MTGSAFSDARNTKKRRNFPTLRQRIIFFNAVALLILIGGVLAVQSSRVGLTDERLAGITEQAQIVANTLAEYTRSEQGRSLNPRDAEPLLRQLIEPTRLRARLYTTDSKLITDTRYLLARNVVQSTELPPLDAWSRVKSFVSRVYDGVMGVRPFVRLDPYFEGGGNGRAYSEVNKALHGEIGTAERVDEQNKLILSVAVPVENFRTIYGVLFVSTEGGDIDDVLREERATLIEVFLVALVVMLISSLYLSSAIANPVRRLAAAADRVRSGRAGRDTIPTMEDRHDEIGALAESFSGMTRALYDRIDAIESFAADVAHELKNPLTSLRNAIEMMQRAPNEETRDKLAAIVRNDVRRIDRLITDISDASRLDAELSREETTPVDLRHLLETIVEVYTVTEVPRGIKLALDLNLGAGATVMARDERLGQVVRNLIDNAISFSPDNGTVTVSAQTQGDRGQIIVEDEGEGISAESLETIFDRFYTSRPAEKDFGKNSGLGLSIARQIAQGMGGRIWAENREGGGARFIVELPLMRGV
ncbi:MAG TPA: stimulus-sensing domain-containing protein [Rhizomicrobium sp.]|jgi:two-component system sensor histidine kinase ChvG|nr:stimulus-sensing domain-containing protein [Rhizomicrobium sp.]